MLEQQVQEVRSPAPHGNLGAETCFQYRPLTANMVNCTTWLKRSHLVQKNTQKVHKCVTKEVFMKENLG